ncbi:MAG: hypothetical protein PHD04_02825 [Candidatus Pacebacteria bacterium]|nr:hypothetical protein [Candidatus Paceibacterota bacterium]
MASRLVTKAPLGFTLLEMHSALAAAANQLNSERARLGISRFATLYVGPMLMSPVTDEVLFVVSHSDNDPDAAEQIDLALERLIESRRRNRWWYLRRDPYCA